MNPPPEFIYGYFTGIASSALAWWYVSYENDWRRGK
jgi:hypothetical protein